MTITMFRPSEPDTGQSPAGGPSLEDHHDDFSPVIGESVQDPRWVESGFSDDESLAWIMSGFRHPMEARWWANFGFLPEEAKKWATANLTPHEAAAYRSAGCLNSSIAEGFSSFGIEPGETADWIKSLSSIGIEGAVIDRTATYYFSIGYTPEMAAKHLTESGAAYGS